MGEQKQCRDAAEFEGDAGSITGGALSEAGMARRSFLGQLGRWSAALAALGLGPEAWMRVVSGSSMISSAVAAGATRDRQLHPFPEDDPFNMPLGTNVWYASPDDPASYDIRTRGGGIKVNNGWSHPIYMSTTSDPWTFIDNRTSTNWGRQTVWSYLEEEHRKVYSIYAHLRADALPAISSGSWSDRHLHIIFLNDLIETWSFRRDGGDTSGQASATVFKIVRNRLDRYSFGKHGSLKINNPLANVAGCRAWGGSAIAGLIRKHEVETANPHIPHALAMDIHQRDQIGGVNQGNPASPLYSFPFMFPATVNDWPDGRYPNATGSAKMGMRFALDPTICTDTWINQNAPNIHQAAVARALRDYGVIVVDESYSSSVIAAEQGISSAVANNLTRSGSGWGWCRSYLRRVAGSGPVHNPGEAQWDTWRANGEGWGGGPPRVPYSPPLASLSGDAPPPLPEAPRAIEVTRARTFDGTG